MAAALFDLQFDHFDASTIVDKTNTHTLGIVCLCVAASLFSWRVMNLNSSCNRSLVLGLL